MDGKTETLILWKNVAFLGSLNCIGVMYLHTLLFETLNHYCIISTRSHINIFIVIFYNNICYISFFLFVLFCRPPL